MVFEPKKFDIFIDDAEIADLKRRLADTRLPDSELLPLLKGWDYGTNLGWLKAMVAKWHDEFDFSKLQRGINRWPHFKAEIEDLDIHFIHVRSSLPNAVPILLVHGWPGSFMEFRHLIDSLVNPASSKDLAFHVVVPSLPGYAFSETPRTRGWTMADNARIFNSLMVNLGYDKYVCQGGDWGHQVCRYLGSLFTDNCKMVHLNMCPAPPPKSFAMTNKTWMPQCLGNALRGYLFTPVEEFLCRSSTSFGINGFGYAQIQGTRPATIGYALLDTPVGHLCWLGEKWMKWSDQQNPSDEMFAESNGQLLSDDILANVSLYWFTKTILSSFIPYLENRDNRYENYSILNLTMVLEKKYYISVPMGMSSFKHELAGTTRGMVAKSGDLKFYREHDQGGHFAALDRPTELLNDIVMFVKENHKSALEN